MSTEAAVAEFSSMLSQQGTGTPETAAPEVATQEPSQPAQQAAAPTQKQVTDYFEAMMDGKPMKLPYNLELPIKHNGNMMNVPLDKLANVYRQFEHIQSKHKDFQTKQDQFNTQLSEYEQLKGQSDKFGAIQKWSEENPEGFERLWQMYEGRDQILSQNPEQYNPLLPELNALKQKLSSIEPVISEFQKAREAETAQKEISMIETQISDFKKEYPNFDLSEKDLDGIDLESRIIQHGINNGYKDFLSAAYTFPGLTQRLVESVRASVKTDMAKQIKSDTKNGIYARSAAPSQVKSNGPLNVKRMSEDDRTASALDEYMKLTGAGA